MNCLVDNTRTAGQQRNLLRSMLSAQVFKFGEFQLKSGMTSPIYIDLRECFAYADVMELAAEGLRSQIEGAGLDYQAIVGVPYAALPYSTLVAHRVKKPLIIIRKEAKAYGTKKLIEGLYSAGQRVVIIEDVVTTGGSIRDVVKILRDEGGLVVEDVFCLLDREQGGRDKLKEDGIKLHSLLNMNQILTFLFSVEKITNDEWTKIVNALNLGYKSPLKVPIQKELEDLTRLPYTEAPRMALKERLALTECALNKKLIESMLAKNSNLCLAIDYTESEQILELAEKAGPFVIAVKVHADAINDFSVQFTEKLVQLANDHNFLIFEDRKFGDTGNTNLLQLKGSYNIAKWADVVTVHAVQGSDSIGNVFRKVISDPSSRLSGVLLIAQLSTAGSLTALPDYTQSAVEIGATNRDVVCGYICQTRVSGHAGDLHWTPGVNLDATSDNAGQQWRGIEQAIVQQQNDIIIVGRGVTASKSPVNELKRYRAAAWEALTAGHQNGN